ncbi:MAG: CPBP family intramembrane metalloprotease [Bacilli bacterium]|nr:CPBP family intramembrane metalloprotease [Bacilli bacterium]
MQEEKIIDIGNTPSTMDYMAKKQTSVKAIIFYVLLMYVANVFLQFILMIVSPIITGEPLFESTDLGELILNDTNNIFIISWTQILIYTAMTIALIWVVKKYLINDLIRFKNKIWKGLLKVLIGFVLFYLVAILCDEFIKLIGIESSSANQEALEIIIKGPYSILVLITIVLMGPICEEIIFRKSAFNLFKPTTNKWVKIAVTGAIFGSIHVLSAILSYITAGESIKIILEECILGIPYILQGMVLGYIYQSSDENIVPVTIVHILNNTLAAIAIFVL